MPQGLFGTPADSGFEIWQCLHLSFVLLLSTSSLNENSFKKKINHMVDMKMDKSN